MPRFRVILTDMIEDDLGPERGVFGDHAEVVAIKAKEEIDLFGHIEDADGLLIYNVPFTAACIERLTKCKAMVRCGVGYDNIDGAFARSRGIPLANVPDYGTEEVADSAIGLMLSLTRGIHVTNSRLQRKLGPWFYKQVKPLNRLRGRVYGVVGLGRIGTAAAIRAKALGMDVAFCDPYAVDGLDKALGIRRVEKLPDLLRQAHVISVHTPLTPKTQSAFILAMLFLARVAAA